MNKLGGESMIYGYIRVCADEQNAESQKFEIQNFAKRNDLTVDEWIEDAKLVSKAGKGDLILVSEISQLGCNLLQVMGTLDHLLNIGARIWTAKDGYKLGEDIPSRTLAFAFGLFAELERKMISQRTKEALARVRANGKALGRPVGRRNTKSKLDGMAGEVRRLLARGYSQSEVARKLKVHRNTLAAFIKKRAKRRA
ncbi:MAG: recombinase family protein [Fibromonadales bacterium]|nr:recombinase family protein [Fibromonadales bacterium]